MATRDQWIDTARGMALCFVVLNHSDGLLKAAGFPVSEHLADADVVLDSFRMPILLMVSGLLATGIGAWNWGDVWRRRVGPLLLLYVIWATIYIVVVQWLRGGTLRATVLALADTPIRPTSPLWYLVALAIYIALAKALRNVPAAVLVPIAAAMSAASYAFYPAAPLTHNMQWWINVAQHWVFFLCAERFARQYRALVARTRPAIAVTAAVVFAAAGTALLKAGLLVGTGTPRSALPALVLAVFATVCALTVFPLVAHMRAVSWATAIGRVSLGVYVTHVMIALAAALVVAEPASRLSGPGLGLLVPLVVAAGVTAIAYGLTRLMYRFTPVPLMRPWWSTKAREPRQAVAPAQ